MPHVTDNDFSNIQVRLTFRFGRYDKNDVSHRKVAKDAHINAAEKERRMRGENLSVVAPRERSASEIARE